MLRPAARFEDEEERLLLKLPAPAHALEEVRLVPAPRCEQQQLLGLWGDM
jgi:hypothetical protein